MLHFVCLSPFLKIKECILLFIFLAVLVLCCCAAFSHCGVWASHCGGFSHCVARILKRAGSVVPAPGLLNTGSVVVVFGA